MGRAEIESPVPVRTPGDTQRWSSMTFGGPATRRDTVAQLPVTRQPSRSTLRQSRQDGLPTYEQSVQAGPSSSGDGDEQGGLARFGRWRGWVEKRAVERYDGVDRDERRAARLAAREESARQEAETSASPVPLPPSYDATFPYPSPVQYPPASNPSPLENTPFTSVSFGSPFIRHSAASITCSLPVLGGRLLLYGTAEGLMVLDSDEEEAPAKMIWSGLPVWQIEIISSRQSPSSSTPKGSILLFCGGNEDSAKLGHPKKGSGTEIRVYSLASLISLARWSALQQPGYQGRDMAPEGSRAKEWTMVDQVSIHPLSDRQAPSASAGGQTDLPKAWSGDYTVLQRSTASEKIGNRRRSGSVGNVAVRSQDILCTVVWRDEGRVYVASGMTSQAVVHEGTVDQDGMTTFIRKKSLALPAAPVWMGFMKLPENGFMPSRAESIDLADDASSVFEYDRPPSSLSRTSSSYSSMRSRQSLSRSGSRAPSVKDNLNLGLYVSFGQKACLIGVSDAVVLGIKSRGHDGDGMGEWGPLKRLVLPDGGLRGEAGEVYAITRGRETCLFASPFEVPSHLNSPMEAVLWPEIPTSISLKLFRPVSEDLEDIL
ncbi:hypothetical protein B9479_006693 [Cryptococcus floricola]|uniref:Uncharacterized protein n=1 Tax=Cryptococcus floricola TaxID=2591691 RepID=A0A5D3AMC8_9TREE|nr:hypothetical protein B9479_006693 [Cryptococcus floricola]